jgi:hypothetical protein
MTIVKNLCLLAFTLVLCGLFYSCDDKQQVTNPNFEAITGKFLNENGNPIAGITVEATDANGQVFSTDVTDADGFFKIQNVPTEMINGIVSFVNAGEIIHQEQLKNIVNTCNAANASGKVGNVFQGGDNDCETVFKLTIQDAETKQPIQDAAVLMGTSRNSAFRKISDANGNVFFENIAPGKYTLMITKTDYEFYQEAFLLLFSEGADTLIFRWTVELNKTGNDSSGNNGGESGICCTNTVKFYIIDIETNEKIRLQDVPNSWVRCSTRENALKNLVLHNDGLVEFNNLCVEPAPHLIQGWLDGYE